MSDFFAALDGFWQAWQEFYAKKLTSHPYNATIHSIVLKKVSGARYICSMTRVLDNPVYYSLLSWDARLGTGKGQVRFFDEEVSPFAGFREGYEKGFEELYELLPSKRKILFAIPHSIKGHEGWELIAEVKGLQFIMDRRPDPFRSPLSLTPLTEENVEEMVQLTTLTKPGPFSKRTIEFGNYFGIFENKKLVAMTGQRLHVSKYAEVSAVCTHPDHTGKGFAAALMQHQLNLIYNSGQIPFLHVRADNERAIELYKRLGFRLRGDMNFYFLKRKK